MVVTWDGDFLDELDEDEYRATIYFEDATLSAYTVAEIVNNMSRIYPQSQIRGIEKVGRSWL